MSNRASDDSEYCSDFSCDSLNLSSAGRGDDCETLPSAETSISVNGANDSSETEVMEIDHQLPWYDATESFLRSAGANNMEVDGSPDPSPNASSDEAWTAGYNQTLMQTPNGVDDMSQLFDKLVLASGGMTKTARSDDGYNRRKRRNMRVARSWSSMRNLSHRRAKTTPHVSESKQLSYLELYRRKMYGLGASTKRPANILKQEEQRHLQAASKQSTEEETHQCETECLSNTPIYIADDAENIGGKSDELRDIASEEVIEEPSSKFPNNKQFTQAACDVTKSVSEHETQNKKQCIKRNSTNFKNLRQAPLKLGSLGFDKEAVKEKYERFRKQQCYGEQASIRNRIKMSQTHKACDKLVEDKKDVNLVKSDVSESDSIPKRSSHVKVQQKPDSRLKNENSKAARAKNYSEAVRASAIASRRSGLKSMVLPSRNSMDTTITPLVERHLKENEIVDTIRRSFGRTKLNLKP